MIDKQVLRYSYFDQWKLWTIISVTSKFEENRTTFGLTAAIIYGCSDVMCQLGTLMRFVLQRRRHDGVLVANE